MKVKIRRSTIRRCPTRRPPGGAPTGAARRPAKPCSTRRCERWPPVDPAPLGQPDRQGDRRHLGRGQIPVRRHRRVVGRRATPHRRTARRRAGAHRSRAPPCANGWPASSTCSIDGLTAPDSRAIETLRSALPRDGAELERLYPQTAAELASWGRSWIEACQKAFADVDVDPDRVREVASFIPGAMRGIASERQLGSYYDLDEARRGLTNAIVNYLQHSRRQ